MRQGIVMSEHTDSTDFKFELGKHIQRLRTAAGFTQESLAMKAGLTRATIAEIEKGAANPSLDGLTRIAGALGLQITDLFAPDVVRQSMYIMQPVSGDLYTPLVEQLTSVQNGELHMQVAYAKSSGVDLITGALQTFRKAGGTLRILVGIDQKNTTAEALYKLMCLCDDLCVVHDRAFVQTYHPKIFMVRDGKRAWVAVGSNNLTRGGLCTNYETCHTQILNLTTAQDRNAYATLTGAAATYREAGLVRQITSEEEIQALLRSDLIVTEQQSRQTAATRARFTTAQFGHRPVSRLPASSETIAVPASLTQVLSEETGKSHGSTPPPAAPVSGSSEITAASLLSLEASGDIQETYWFEMRASTGGSRNILDLSSSAKLREGSHPDADQGVIPGSVAFFGLDPQARDTGKNITVVYNGIAYYPSTIKFAPNNASWRIQLKGDAETGDTALSQFGRTDFANHILVFHRITPDHYVLETMAERELPALKAASVFWATNGSSRASKAFGRIKLGQN